MNDTTDLRERLNRIASTPRTTPPLDIDEFAVRGRRSLRRRRAMQTAGAVVAAALAGTLVVTGLPGTGADKGPTAPVLRSPARPNPLIQRATFGWLPDGYRLVSASERVNHQRRRATFSASTGPKGALKGRVVLEDWGVGPEPKLVQLRRGRPPKRLRAPDVKGHPAYWITNTGLAAGGRLLRWQYGTGRWAELQVSMGPHDQTSTIYKIVESVTFDAARPTPFPLRVKGIPADFKVVHSSVQTTPGGSAYLNLSRSGRDFDYLSIGLSPARPFFADSKYTGPEKLMPNATIDGHPAFERFLTKFHAIMVFGVGGYDVDISASGDSVKRLEASGGLIGLYRRITVLGADPSRWTTEPFSDG